MQNIEEKQLVSKYEPILFKTSLIISILLWIIIIFWTLGIWAIYAWILALIWLIVHIWFISYVKWNWVRVTQNQFPELDEIKKEIAKDMWFTKYTHMYVVNFDWMLNAFATKLLSRNFVIITASILEACDNDIDKLKFIIAHELAHLKRKHVHRQALLLPSKIIPWLGNAYSKACEYTCDNYGAYYWTKNSNKAVKWLAVLAAGWIYSEKINIDAYLEQAQESNDFWMSLNETKSTHPYLTKRVFNIMKTFEDNSLKLPKRNIFWVLLAPFTNLWLWITITYLLIIWATALESFKNLEEKAKEMAWTNTTIETENIWEILSKDYKTIDKKYLDIFTKIYNKYKNKWKYQFFIYNKKYDTSNQYTSLYITDFKNWTFYVENDWEKLKINSNDKDLWGIEINEVNNDSWYLTEEDDIEEFEKLLKK